MAKRRVRPVLAIVTAMDEYQTCILGGVHDALAERGIPLLVHCDGPLDRGARSGLLVAMLRSASPVGIIELNSPKASEQAELASLLETVEVPIVRIGNSPQGATSVCGDNAGGMGPLLDHLFAQRGLRHPVLVRGLRHHADAEAREDAFYAALTARDIPIDEGLVIDGGFSPEPTYVAMHELLRRRRDFDAVVAMNDLSAVSVIAALHEVGLRVPEDVAVTGYDNDLIATQWPGLTTVDQGLEEQGAVAAALLMERLDGEAPGRNVVVASRLVIRGSTAPPGEPPVREVTDAVAIARSDKAQLAAQDASLALSDALNHRWTIEQVVDVVAEHLHRLGISRCFLALHDRQHDDSASGGTGARVDTEEARIVLAYAHGERLALPDLPVRSRDLLPPELGEQLDHDMLVLQPLAMLDRPLGYLLFEQTTGSARVGALMRTELSRAIDAVLTTRELRAHAQMLEQVVDRRTRELQAEIMTRQRTERELQRANTQLQRSAMLDGLTRIANRTAFEEHLQRHWAPHVRADRELALLMVDVDAFKPYNDHYGHVAGDEALRTVADCLERAVSGTDDLACRYGGEEFCVVLPGSGRTAALAVSERFRALLAAAAIPHVASPTGSLLTASIGVSVGSPTPGEEPESLIRTADRALYQAKSDGRDRVVVVGDRPCPPPSARR